jgi:hypothetical protein
MKKMIAGLCLFAAAAAANAAAPIAKIQSMLAKPNVLCGRFDQTKQLAGMKKPLLSNGRFCVVAGKGVLWRTLQPFPDTLRLTHDEIVHYQGDRVTNRLDAKTEPTVRMINSVLFSLLSGDLTQLDSLFEVNGTAEANGWHVALQARRPELAKAIGAITLNGNAYVKDITIDEASGDRTGIVFSGMKTGEAAMLPEEAALF